MKIVFRSPNFVAIDKSSGCLSVPSRQGILDPRPVAGRLLEEHLKCQIYPVHRLDEEVSGLLLFALSTHGHREANQAFEQHWVQKRYQALSEGPLPELIKIGEKQEWRCTLVRGKKRSFEAPYGKEALTHAICTGIKSWREMSLLEWNLFPLTGRSHQLRYEMYRHKRPIVGDSLYGSKLQWTDAGIALRSLEINFKQAHERGILKELPELLQIEALTLP